MIGVLFKQRPAKVLSNTKAGLTQAKGATNG
jgi:hypothetical protein